MGTQYSIHHPPKKANGSVTPGAVIAWGDFNGGDISKDLIYGLLLPIGKGPPVPIEGQTQARLRVDLWCVVFQKVPAGEYVLEIWTLKKDGSGVRDTIRCRRRVHVKPIFRGISMSAPAQGATVYTNFMAGGSDDVYQPVTCWFNYGAAQPVLGADAHDGVSPEPYWLQSFSIAVAADTPNCTCSATNALQPPPVVWPAAAPAAQVSNSQITLKAAAALPPVDSPGDDAN